MTAQIDYLTLTRRSSDARDDDIVIEWKMVRYRFESYVKMLAPGLVPKLVAGNRMPFYDVSAMEGQTGIRYAMSRNMHSQGEILQLSGKALRSANVSADDIAGFINAGWRASRVDLCVDIFSHADALESLCDTAGSKRDEGFSRKVQVIRAPTGDSLYVGSRRSPKMLRVYDKGSQMRVDTPWVRFEMEYKGAAAMNALGAWFEDPSAPISDMLVFLNAPANPLCIALDKLRDAEITIASTGSRPDPDANAWFDSTVMAAFKKWASKDPARAAAWWDQAGDEFKKVTGFDISDVID